MTDVTSGERQAPRKGDRLFRGDLSDWTNNACLNVAAGGDWFAYQEGYRRAGRLLSEHVQANSRDQDYLVYPVVFLYRHHIELVLKRCILRALLALDREVSEPIERHLNEHRLNGLWEDLLPLLADVCIDQGWDQTSPYDLEGIGDYISQLSEIDRDSMSFRYSHSKRGQLSLPKNLTHINLRHFSEKMECLAGYLDGVDTGLWMILSERAAMDAELDRAMDSGTE